MIGAIWAHAHGVIGADGEMPWHLPEDLAHFKDTTMGAAVLMGRATWQSLPQQFRPLKGRQNFVASRDETFQAPGATLIDDLPAFLSDPRWQHEDLWVMGGGQIYRAAMDQIERASVTEIDADVQGDTFAPTLPAGDYSCGPWQTSRGGLAFRICTWTRAESPRA